MVTRLLSCFPYIFSFSVRNVRPLAPLFGLVVVPLEVVDQSLVSLARAFGTLPARWRN